MSLRKRISTFLAPPQPSAPLAEEPPQAPEETLVKLHDFRKDGEFDYQGYRAVQLLKAKADKGDV